MRGITRDVVLALAADEGLPVRQCDFSLAQVYAADEAFCTGEGQGAQGPNRELFAGLFGDPACRWGEWWSQAIAPDTLVLCNVPHWGPDIPVMHTRWGCKHLPNLPDNRYLLYAALPPVHLRNLSTFRFHPPLPQAPWPASSL